MSAREEPPTAFVCPISFELMAEPVLLAGDGFTYSKSSLIAWFQKQQSRGMATTSPLTNELVDASEIFPNKLIATQINDYCTSRGLPLPVPVPVPVASRPAPAAVTPPVPATPVAYAAVAAAAAAAAASQHQAPTAPAPTSASASTNAAAAAAAPPSPPEDEWKSAGKAAKKDKKKEKSGANAPSSSSSSSSSHVPSTSEGFVSNLPCFYCKGKGHNINVQDAQGNFVLDVHGRRYISCPRIMEKLCPAPLPSDTVQGTLPCANDRIGVVIGTKGMTIHRMMTLSGCLNIVVDMEKTPRVVVMTGSIEQVRSATRMAAAVVAYGCGVLDDWEGFVDPAAGAGAGGGKSVDGMCAGDWICPGCSHHNFAKKTFCFSCHTEKPGPSGGARAGAGKDAGARYTKIK